MNDQSQDYLGPYIIGFGEFYSKIVDAEYCYSLSKNEFRLLLKFAGTIDRTGYRANLSDIKMHKLETWAEMCRVGKTHMSRSFRSLKELEIIEPVKVGKRNYHRFHPNFVQAIFSGQMFVVIREKDAKKKIDSYQTGQLSELATLAGSQRPSNILKDEIGDNTEDSYQTGQPYVTKPGNHMLPNRVTDSYQTGQLALYIEGFSSKISLPPITPSSIPSDPQPVDNVDNFIPSNESTANLVDSFRSNNSIKDMCRDDLLKWVDDRISNGSSLDLMETFFLGTFGRDYDRKAMAKDFMMLQILHEQSHSPSTAENQSP